MGGKGSMPDVPEPTPIPKPKQEVDVLFRKARNEATRRKTRRGLAGTDVTGGLLSAISLGKASLAGGAKKTLLGE